MKNEHITERDAPHTVGNLIKYLQRFTDETPVYIDIDGAVQDGHDDDYVGVSYVSLSFALGEIEERVQHNDG